ncbi:zinc finger BED domain-containing protein RICESLEEPER 2-like protein [Tanacetum coccineum]
MASGCGQSQSSVGVGDSSTNLMVVAIKETKRNPAIWSNYDLCVMSSGPKKARCKKCGAFFAQDGNTTLKNHMNKSCPALKAASGSSQTTMGVDGSLWHYEAARVRERMAQFVIQETLPFDHFDNKRMTSLIQETLQPRYCHVSRTTLRHDCLNMWKVAKDEMILGFGALETGVSLTCDVWTAPHGSPDLYLCVTAHWVNPKTWVMMKRTIAFELFGYPHTGQNLYAILDYVIKTYHLEEKIFSISFDSASNITVAVDQLKLKYKPICDGVFFHSLCVTHIINLVVQDGLHVIGAIKNDFKQMLKDIFSTSNARYQRYMKFCTDANALWLGPNWDVPTRWNSTCNMFECALRQKNTLKVFHDQLAQRNLVTPYPESSWDTIQRVSDFLGVFKKATTLLSGVYYPTNCLVLFQLFSITSKINDCEMRGEFYENMVKPMKEKLKTYFKELSPVITCAAALNPTLNRFGVETLIEKISYDLGLFEEDPNHIVNQCARFNDAFDKMFQVYLTKYDSSSTNIHGM